MKNLETHTESFFVNETQTGGCNMPVLEKRRSFAYVDEQNLQIAPQGCVAVERSF